MKMIKESYLLRSNETDQKEMLKNRERLARHSRIQKLLLDSPDFIAVLDQEFRTLLINHASPFFSDGHIGLGYLPRTPGELLACAKETMEPGCCGVRFHCQGCPLMSLLMKCSVQNSTMSGMICFNLRRGEKTKNTPLKVHVEPLKIDERTFFCLSFSDCHQDYFTSDRLLGPKDHSLNHRQITEVV
jgi:hypothetical protein